jgi:molybdenum cofactor cytidylyltransferase
MAAHRNAGGRLLDLDCIVPAAGLARRIDGRKLTRDFRGRPLIMHALANALEACRRVIVVVGHDEQAVRAALAPAETAQDRQPSDDAGRVVIVTNPHYRHGMITSIARGALEVHSPRFFVAPADMPFLASGLYRAVAAAAAAGDTGSEHAMAWFPVLRGKPAHPVLVCRDVLPALFELVRGAMEAGARSVPPAALPSMRAFLHSYDSVDVPVDNEGSTIDIDTPAALERYGGGNPDPAG